MSTIAKLAERKLCQPPRWLPHNMILECMGGSVSYGVTSDTSDVDLVGIVFPMKDDLFPHLRGEIPGFGRQHQRFEQYQQHHINDENALGGKGREYDITVYSIVKFFQLAMDNNPNIIDILFVPHNCVLYSTPIGELIRERRKLFLHKGAWAKFKGYSYSQLAKIGSNKATGKRLELIEKYGYDVKYAYHLVRLLLEIEQIMTEHDLDLQRHREQLKAIRRGEWTEHELRVWAAKKESELETVYHTSTLRYKPDEAAIKQVLMDCLEAHYGNLSGCIVNPDATLVALRNIQTELEKVKNLL